VIGTKSRRPRWRFSLLPHGERSARAPISAAARVTKFPLIVFIHVAHDAADSAFLPWAPLPSSHRHAAAGAHCHKLARPSATAGQPVLPPRAAAPFWLGLGIKESRLHRVLRHRLLRHLSLCIGFVSWCSLCRHSPPLCSRRWCRTFSVSLPSDHPWDVAICMRPSGPLHRCRS